LENIILLKTYFLLEWKWGRFFLPRPTAYSSAAPSWCPGRVFSEMASWQQAVYQVYPTWDWFSFLCYFPLWGSL